jgi:TPR repeat protein
MVLMVFARGSSWWGFLRICLRRFSYSKQWAKPSDRSDAFAARTEFGRLYSSGLGLSVDPIKALRWYKEAIALASDEEDSAGLREARDYVARANIGR